MKKNAPIYLLIFLLLPTQLHSVGLVIGLKGGGGASSYFGPDYSTYLWEGPMENALALGYSAGVFLSFELFRVLALQPELLVTQSGNAKAEEAFIWGIYEGNAKYTDSVSYLSVPFLLKVFMGNAAVYFGPEVRMKITSGVSRFTASDEELQNLFDGMGLSAMSYSDEVFASVVFAAAVGTEYLLPYAFLRGEWAIESRLRYVFSNIYNESQGLNYQSYEVSLMMSYGWRVLKGRERR